MVKGQGTPSHSVEKIKLTQYYKKLVKWWPDLLVFDLAAHEAGANALHMNISSYDGAAVVSANGTNSAKRQSRLGKSKHSRVCTRYAAWMSVHTRHTPACARIFIHVRLCLQSFIPHTPLQMTLLPISV